MSFLNELKRRNVLRVAAAYAVVAWLIIQVAETIFPLFGFGDTPARIVVIVLAIGIIPALVFAWAFELTPEGLKKERDIDRSRSITPQTGKKLDRMIMVVLALALGYFAFDKFVLDPRREAKLQEEQAAQLATVAEQSRQEGRTEALVGSYDDKSIAVLPFVNMSDDADNEYFSDGISEELLNLLAKVPELRVISRSSAFSFKDQNLEIPEIAKRLNVAHILEGSVRKDGNRVRITAQLIHARSDTHLWSETYDRTLDDIFAIQDEVAANIVENLQIKIVGPMPKARRTNPKALAMLLQAKQIWYQSVVGTSSADAANRMDALLDAALGIDPDFADALSWKSLADFIRLDGGEISPEEYRRRNVQRDKTVLAIDPEHAGVLARQAFEKTFVDVDIAGAIPLWERAYRSAPNDAEVLRQVARFAAIIGRFDISTPLFERAVSLDPFCTMCLYFLSLNYMWAHEWDKAEEARERYLLIGGGGGYYYYGTIKLLKGDTEEALESYRRHRADGAEYAGISMALFAMGQREESDVMLAKLIETAGDEGAASVATAYAFRDEKDAAFEWLEKTLRLPLDPVIGKSHLFSLVLNPALQNLHDDPRWEAFRANVGLPTELIESLQFSIDIAN